MSTPNLQSIDGSMSTTADQRKFPRVSSRCLVSYRRVDNPEAIGQVPDDGPSALLQNISGGGVCVSMPEDPGMGNLLALTMHLPNMDSAVISLGKVAWSRPGDGGEWDVGVEFWWVGWEDKDAQESIRDYISSTLKSKPSG